MTDRIPLDDLTIDQYDQLCDDLDRYEEVQGEMNEQAINLTRRAAAVEATLGEVLDAFEAYWARASYCGPDMSAVQPEHFQAWRTTLTPAAAATEAACAYPHGKPGIASLLEHVGLDTRCGVTVAGRPIAQPCTCGGTFPINHVLADQHLPVPAPSTAPTPVPCPACRRADQAGLAPTEQHDDCANQETR